MYHLHLYPDSRFKIHILKIEYDYGCKPENLLLQLEGIGWRENGLVRNPLMEMPNCTQEYSVCMESDNCTSAILSQTKSVIKNSGATLRVLKSSPTKPRY